MKILVVAQDLTPGNGWGTIARNTVVGLQDRGHDVCALLQDDTDADCPTILGLPHATAPLGSPIAWIKTTMAIRRAVKKFRPDIIHFAVEPYALAMPIAKYFVNLPPWVLVMLGTYTVQPLYLRHTKPLMKRVYQQCDAFPVCSEYTKGQYLNAIEDTCGVALRRRTEERSPLFRLGIVPPSSSQKERPNNDMKRILFVGGVKPRKGVLDLVKGIRVFREQSSVPFHVDIIGMFNERSDYIRRIREEIADGDLAHTVTLHGHVSREAVEEAYANADVFIMLSKPDGIHFEGFGVVFLEANILGIPTIGPNGSGCKEAIDEGVSGFTVDPEEPEAVAERLQWILENNEIDPKNCIAWAKKHSVDQQIRSFEEVYKAVDAS